MFETLIEATCHAGDVDAALEVFDDVKATDGRVMLGKVTLAFLENRCRRASVPDWRVYDVCAHMRMQASTKRERRVEAGMPRKTNSHHVRGSVDEGEEAREERAAAADGKEGAAAAAERGAEGIDALLQAELSAEGLGRGGGRRER